MNYEYLIGIVLSAVIPSILTYLGTKKSCNSKIKEIELASEKEISQLRLNHTHEIQKLESSHKHLVEKLELEHRLEKETKSEVMSSEMAMKFLSGELDLPKTISNVNDLQKLSKRVGKMKAKQDMSNFVNKH